LRVTFSNCWWSEGCVERMPRVRFGQVHVANCLYSSTVTNYCFGVGYMSKIYAEGNAFVSDKAKANIYKFPNDKAKEAHHFKLVNSLGADEIDIAKGSEEHFDPSTAYSDVEVYSASLVEATVSHYAGATLTEEQLTSRGKPTAVANVSESGEVRSVEYYTIDGVQLASPKSGITLRKTTKGDGKVVTEKIIMK